MEDFFGLRKIKLKTEIKMSYILGCAEEDICHYIEEHKMKTDFVFSKIENTCIDCDQYHEISHFPALRFTCFFEATGEDEFFVELVIFTNDDVKLIVNKSDSFARNLTAERTLHPDSIWIIRYWGEKNVEKEMRKFVDEITPLIFVYTKVLGL